MLISTPFPELYYLNHNVVPDFIVVSTKLLAKILMAKDCNHGPLDASIIEDS